MIDTSKIEINVKRNNKINIELCEEKIEVLLKEQISLLYLDFANGDDLRYGT